MCGIVGFLLAKPGDPGAATPHLEALRTLAPPSEETPEAFDALGRRADTLSRALIHPDAFVRLLLAGDEVAGVRAGLEVLETSLQTAERMAARPGAPLAEVEAWNAAAVRFRDAAWRLDRDLLENLPRVRALCGKAFERPEAVASERLLTHAFRMNLVLNALDRLEVRGRDSAGLCTVVWFDDAAAHAGFLRRVEAAGLTGDLAARRDRADLLHGAVVPTGGARPALAFAHKTAEEIGRLGQNVEFLRRSVTEDRLYWTAVGSPGTAVELLGHTRWASNGIVNEANCHPVDDRSARGEAEGPRFFAVLNGDVDNFQALRDRLGRSGRPVPATVTTDAKVIPMVVAERFRETLDGGEAFQRAMNAFEGAFAIASLSTAEPGRIRLALKGSGQALYVGEGAGGLMVASETYGLVEACGRYVRMEGERPRDEGRRETAGQVLALSADTAFPDGVRRVGFDGVSWPGAPEVFEAGITTRDIHRGAFEHYFLKEITESPEGLEKTLRGKFVLREAEGEARVDFAFGAETVPPAVLERMRAGAFRRALFIGQGTAAVAGMGIARMWQEILGRTGMVFEDAKASELSGFGLRRDMGDTLVVAVSQSGTTTDTNRTVEMVKSRGASVLAIVNRRHSDLVHRADGVIFTSDGRDVEMAVASTKAFYAQVAAGTLLGLYLADAVRALSPVEVARRVRGLMRLPDLMRDLLGRAGTIRELAEKHALTKRHWAVVGSGPDQVAAEEIRIKLSELNYKSISRDFLEDKKHIDLSSEPLVLVCAASQPLQHVPDAVKEVSIFKAHRAVPLVFRPDGEERYETYAAGTIPIPAGVPELAFLLETLAGHLWGYYAARAIDASSRLLRETRAAVVQAMPAVTERRGATLGGALRLLRGRLAPQAREFFLRLRAGRFNSGLEVATASNLLALFAYALGQISLQEFQRDFGDRPTWDALLDNFLLETSRGIGELTRPIDAIKHQAKTVTVGISRGEPDLTGPLFDALAEAGFPAAALDDALRYVLEAASRAVDTVLGFTLYEIEGMDPTGLPADNAVIRVLRQEGAARDVVSRAARPRPLFGTKRQAVARGRIVLGSGRLDGRPLVLIPGPAGAGKARLLLLHVRYREGLSLEDKLLVLRGYYERYEEIRWAAGEVDPAFTDARLEPVPLLPLLEEDLDALVRRILPGERPAGRGPA